MIQGGSSSAVDQDQDSFRGGPVKIKGGSSLNTVGGAIDIQGGHSNQNIGGSIMIKSGSSDRSSSGAISISSSDGSLPGGTASGDVMISSGKSYDNGNPGGSVYIIAGESTTGNSGSISIKVKDSAITDGGTIKLSGGDTHGKMSQGGNVTIKAGAGMSDEDLGDGGDGGALVLSGGFANGRSWIDKGGLVMVKGGDCECWNHVSCIS
jgi:hypothetical protein